MMVLYSRSKLDGIVTQKSDRYESTKHRHDGGGDGHSFVKYLANIRGRNSVPVVISPIFLLGNFTDGFTITSTSLLLCYLP